MMVVDDDRKCCACMDAEISGQSRLGVAGSGGEKATIEVLLSIERLHIN